MLSASVLLGLWVGWQEVPREIARWHLAAGLEHWANAEYQRLRKDSIAVEESQTHAYAAVARALTWNPHDGEIFLQRARWRIQDGDYQAALEDCDQASARGQPIEQVIDVRSTALVGLKRFDDAVQEVQRYQEQLRSAGRELRAKLQLNQVAYFRALGGINLSQALKEIDESLAGLPLAARDPARLDTRGFILFRMGRYQEAIVEFDLAIPIVQRGIVERQRERQRYLRRAPSHRDAVLDERTNFREFAVIYYHRSLVLEKLNRWKEAQRDLRQATELLGRPPDESLF